MPPSMCAPKVGVDAEIETGSAACCRICLESSSGPGCELISPCMCKGTHQFVHRSCLDHWRSVKEGTAFSHCTTCKAQFHLRVQFLEGSRCRKMKFRLFVARDILLVFLAIQASIAALGGFAYLLDKDGKFRNSFADSSDFPSKHPVPFYYCIGVLVFFVLVGIIGSILHCCTCSSSNDDCPCLAGPSSCVMDSECCVAVLVILVIIFAIVGLFFGFLAASIAVQRILQRNYHILTKKELTKAS
ncbi:hypothetical protein EJB05_50319 [Eragrostis curvula]|uniref:RING-CH-type domain-containing protein n=1 Tax=Eragrostis curvula TaxID=38414 RepID=A0A5J9SYN1_9POAL|nr:hypothetical protein EJB05_50319 [Eragrostis curvula]